MSNTIIIKNSKAYVIDQENLFTFKRKFRPTLLFHGVEPFMTYCYLNITNKETGKKSKIKYTDELSELIFLKEEK